MNTIQYFIDQEVELVKSKIYIVKRIDLRRDAHRKNFSDIGRYDVPDMKKLQRAELCYFEEFDGTKKILKNRYGASGVVVTNEKCIDYMRTLNK